jgi:hypothetical protein
MDKVSEQTENLGEMLEESQDTVSDFTATNTIVSDDEINALIYGQQTPGQTTGANKIDEELAALKSQFNI